MRGWGFCGVAERGEKCPNLLKCNFSVSDAECNLKGITVVSSSMDVCLMLMPNLCVWMFHDCIE